jgi:Cof subfamily protein (haloacid dehalogenase superfamily)
MSLFVFDLDGTLIDYDLILKPETINALNLLLEKGHVVCFASGRPFAGAMKFMQHLKDGKKYLVTSNGAVTYTFDGTVIGSHYIKMQDYIDIYNRYHDNPDFCIMIYQNNMIGYTSNKRYVDIEMISNSIDSFYIDISKVNPNENIEKVMIESHLFVSDDIVLPEDYYDKYNIVKGSPHFLEFTNKVADKSIGVEDLRKFLNIDKKDVYTFGDSGNDYLMLKNFNGICMENGFPECKKVAKYVTKSIRENGVIYALKDILKVI